MENWKHETLTGYIYGLYKRGESDVRYIGSTNNPTRRYFALRNADSLDVRKWIRKLKNNYCMTILQIVPANQLRLYEYAWIAYVRQKGIMLLNSHRSPKYTKNANFNHIIFKISQYDYKFKILDNLIIQFPDKLISKRRKCRYRIKIDNEFIQLNKQEYLSYKKINQI